MNRTKELLLSLASPPPHRCYLCETECPMDEDGLCENCRRLLKLAISPAPPEGLDGLSAGLQYCDELSHVFFRFKAKERPTIKAFCWLNMSPPAMGSPFVRISLSASSPLPSRRSFWANSAAEI